MDDFYIYYVLKEDDLLTGVIKAISPVALDEMGDMESIRVSPETGMKFTVGDESISRWNVTYNAKEEAMVLSQVEPEKVTEAAMVFLVPLPYQQDEPQIVVTWNESKKTFAVNSYGVDDRLGNRNIRFFVTREGDPNLLYLTFQVDLFSTFDEAGSIFNCTEDLPAKFSVYAKKEFDRYQLKVQR